MRLFEKIIIYFRRSKNNRFTDQTPLDTQSDLVAPPPVTPLEALELIPEIRAIHNLIALAVNRLSWKVSALSEFDLLTYVEDVVRTRRLEFAAGPLAADYLILGEAWVTAELKYAPPRQPEGLRLERGWTPLASASWLVRKLWEYHRASTQILSLMGAGAFLHPKDAALPLTAEELDAFRRMMRDKLRRGGAGGIEPLSTAVEILPVPLDVEKYRLVEMRTELVRELCNLFAIDSSLMNDPENKTYSNKDLALRALYTNVIIPLAYEIKYKLEILFPKLRIEIDHSNIEVLHSDKQAQADYVINLLKAGVISQQEARDMLEL